MGLWGPGSPSGSGPLHEENLMPVRLVTKMVGKAAVPSGQTLVTLQTSERTDEQQIRLLVTSAVATTLFTQSTSVACLSC